MLIGAIRTCSHVPRSFSRTIASAVDTAPVIMPMNAMRPGTRNSVLSSCGLYQMRGSADTGGRRLTPRRSISSDEETLPTMFSA